MIVYTAASTATSTTSAGTAAAITAASIATVTTSAGTAV